ncbi:MAG: DUF2877 domain-containing protein [Acidimicrobiia bacterium]
MTAGLWVGAGAREVLAVPGPGHVVAVYRRAAYLRLPGGIIALVAPGVPRGPLWVGGAGEASLRLRLPVTVGQGWLEVEGRTLPVGGAEIWWGPLPDPLHLRSGLALAAEVLAGGSASALLEEPWRPGWHRAESALHAGELRMTATVLGGLGPGLTPAGDDALAGILLARHALGDGGGELLDVAGSVVTTDLSRALLRWAAEGQSVEPVHDLLMAVAAGDRPGALSTVARIASLGASSGADLLLGLRLGLAPLRTPPAIHPSG